MNDFETSVKKMVLHSGLSRRQLLQAGALGIGGGLLARQLLAIESHAEEPVPAAAAAKSLVVLWMNGGPSHIDTFDPKKGGKDAGPFKSIATRTPGLRISEHLPLLAARSDKFSVIRSMTSKEGNHQRARYLGHTGYSPNPTVKYPAIGAWISSERNRKGALPSFISIGGPSEGGGFLGVAHAPFVMRKPGGLPQNVGHGFGVDNARFDRRMRGLDFMEGRFDKRTTDASVPARRTVYGRATRMMRAAEVAAFDVSEESQAIRDAYGDSDFGRGCLVARRLVEVGVPMVEVTLDGWDTHRDNFERVKGRSSILDQGMSALLDGLAKRGRLKDTLIVCMGDFGRTPRINANGGRDHHPRAFSALLAGGGTRAGLVYGATDERGAEVVDKPVQMPNLFATVANQLGLRSDKMVMTPGGRPITLTDHGSIIKELVG